MADKVSGSPVWPTLAVKDIPKSKKFYEDVLGYKVMMEDPHNVAYQGADGTGIQLYESAENAGTNKATYCSWKVDDLDDVMGGLNDAGVEFEDFGDVPGMKKGEDGIYTMEGPDGKSMKGVWFKDPDGNILCVMEM